MNTARHHEQPAATFLRALHVAQIDRRLDPCAPDLTAWQFDCPVCDAKLAGHAREHGRGGSITVRCRNGCDPERITATIAERVRPAPPPFPTEVVLGLLDALREKWQAAERRANLHEQVAERLARRVADLEAVA